MSDEMFEPPHPSILGGCRCGDVRFEIVSEHLFVANCHCEDCRKNTGNAFTTYVGFQKKDAFFIKDGRKVVSAAANIVRGFCENCGTSISYEGARWPDEIHLLIGTFDNPTQFTPAFDVQVKEKLPWVTLNDETSHHLNFPSDDKY